MSCYAVGPPARILHPAAVVCRAIAVIVDAGADTSELMRTYLKQIGRVSLLNAEPKVDLATRIDGGLSASKRLRQSEQDHRKLATPTWRAWDWISRNAYGQTHAPAIDQRDACRLSVCAKSSRLASRSDVAASTPRESGGTYQARLVQMDRNQEYHAIGRTSSSPGRAWPAAT